MNCFSPGWNKKPEAGSGSNPLYGEGGAAATRGGGIGIPEGKTPVIQTVLPVDFHTIEVHFMGFLHNIANTFVLILLVAILLAVESQHIGEAGAASPLYAYAQELSAVKAGLTH